MKFKLFIRPHEEEFVQAQVHQKSSFTDQLAEFVASDGSFMMTLTYYNYLSMKLLSSQLFLVKPMQ